MASAHMPDEFFDTLAHHLPPEPPVGPKGGRPRVAGEAGSPAVLIALLAAYLLLFMLII